MNCKRILSFVMAFVLCLSLLPMAAFAAEEEPAAAEIILEEESEAAAETEEIFETSETEETEESSAPEESAEPAPEIIEEESEETAEEVMEIPEDGSIIDFGSCGGHDKYPVNWTMSDTGVLTISGSGRMVTYGDEQRAAIWTPWYDYRDSINKVIIKSGVYNVGAYVFYGYSALTSVIIEDGVSAIYQYAFADCSSLKYVSIPESVYWIGSHAFYNCAALTGVNLPEGLSEIQYGTFAHCGQLTDVDIPDSVTKIEKCAFYECSSLTGLYIPDSVESIGEHAFNGCRGLTKVTIDSAVLYSIGECAFNRCTSLSSITVNTNNKYYTSINGILYNKSKTTLICCPAGKSGKVTIPSGVTWIKEYAFEESALSSVTIPSSVGTIDERAFCYCGNLTSITIPSGVKSIDSTAFNGCNRLTSITVKNANETYSSKSGMLYNKAGTKLLICPQGKSGSITVPAGTTYIGSYAFENCSKITALTIPDGVSYIYEGAFYNCSKLTSITIPGVIISIGKGAFKGCDSLKNFYYCGSEALLSKVSISGNNDILNSVQVYYNCNAVIYNANGGKGAPASGVKFSGKSYTIPTTKPTRTGYTFLGWSGSKTAKKASYLPGKSYSCIYLNLYAVWKVKTYTVTYYANGGSGAPKSGTKTYGRSFTVATTKPTRTGYTFLGWSGSKTATKATYLPGKSYSSIYLKLYAVWKIKTYTVKFYANGGSGAPASRIKTYGQAFTIPTTKPTRTGYTFLGWSNSKTATTAKYLPGKSYTSMYLTLYAVWRKN